MTFDLLLGKRVVAGGNATTINLSSNGLLFKITSPLWFTALQLIEHGGVLVTIPWPAEQDGVELELLAEGHILRCEPPYYAIDLARHQLQPRLAPCDAQSSALGVSTRVGVVHVTTLSEVLTARHKARAELDLALARIRLLTAEWQATGVKPITWMERAGEARIAQAVYDEANDTYRRALNHKLR